MVEEREFNRMTGVFKKQADVVKNIADKIEKIDSLGGGGVGKDVTGTKYTIDETEYTAGSNAEIFNDYTNNKAIGQYSHAEGSGTKASGDNSHAEGGGTTASGMLSHAEGAGTTASGPQSHAEGGGTTASGNMSHAEGCSVYSQAGVISITSSTTNDEIITAWNSKKFSLAKGNSSHVEGQACLALGDC